jgi:acetyltransferase-like isoleucine patch superfamily enzyme
MSGPIAHAKVALEAVKRRATEAVLAHRIRARNPTMRCHPSAIWDYPYREIDAIQIGRNVHVFAWAEILVYPTSKHSSVRGGLVLGDGVIISKGVDIRAAGGMIRIGNGSGIAQHSVLVAANHRPVLGQPIFHTPWEETRTGVTVGTNVWVGANCVLLPGVTIGDNSLIAAGSVVSRDVPPNEIWGGVPARKLKDVPAPEHARA